MYKKGDYIFHENGGVCKVEDMREIAMNGFGSEKMYYVLLPFHESRSQIFSPVDAPKNKLRDIMSKETLQALIDKIPSVEINWIKNDKLRIQYYKEALATSEPERIIEVLKTVYIINHKRAVEGKKMLTADDRFYQIAGKKIFDEIAYVYDIDMREAEDMIENVLQKCLN